MTRASSWFKAKNHIDAAQQLQRGGIQNDDPRYNSETRVQQPTEPPPFRTQQQAPQQQGHNASYCYPGHPRSPFATNMNSQGPQYCSTPFMQGPTTELSLPGCEPHQGQVMGQNFYIPAQGFVHSAPQYFDQTPQDQSRTTDLPNTRMNQENFDAWPNPSAHNSSVAPFEYNSTPTPPYYGPNTYDHTPQRSATEYGQSYGPPPSWYPRSQTLLEGEWERYQRCHHPGNVGCRHCEPIGRLYEEPNAQWTSESAS